MSYQNKGYERVPDDGVRSMQIDASRSEISTVPTIDTKHQKMYYLGGGVIVGAVLLWFMSSSSPSNIVDQLQSGKFGQTNGHSFDDFGRYIMKNFDEIKPMSNFLAGVGGLWGTPLWTFYVNRGQALASFGVTNKDGSISSYETAEKAYQLTPFTGFRTFIKAERSDGQCFHHQPFFPDHSGKNPPESLNEQGVYSTRDTDTVGSPSSVTGGSAIENRIGRTRDMHIGQNELEIIENDPKLGLKTEILYIPINNENFPGIIRQVKFTNIDQNTELKMDVLDGLAKLEPSGLSNNGINSMGRTLEAWMRVYNVGGSEGGGHMTQPYYHISQDTADNSQASKVIQDGHFAVAFKEVEDTITDVAKQAEKEANLTTGRVQDSDSSHKRKLNPLYTPGDDAGTTDKALKKVYDTVPFIVDPTSIFGYDTSLMTPTAFYDYKGQMANFMSEPQTTTSKTPCAMAGHSFTLAKNGGTITLTMVIGHSMNLEEFVDVISPKVRQQGFSAKMRKDGSKTMEDITRTVKTSTSNPVFDSYISQDYLDNVLRGGVPLTLGASHTDKKDDTDMIYHTFNRIHGDLERDYNNFVIEPTVYSQGPGNFRDVNQNRRMDTLMNPSVKDFNIRMFLSFIQADGYNPLVVASTIFHVEKGHIVNELVDSLGIIDPLHTGMASKVKDVLTSPWRPGSLFLSFKQLSTKFTLSNSKILEKIMTKAIQTPAAKYEQNGFWSDHWVYILDMVDTYLMVYPEKESHLLWDSAKVPFFMSPAYIKPRSERYVLVPNPDRSGTSTLRVLNAVVSETDTEYSLERYNEMKEIMNSSSYFADHTGAGSIWQRSAKDKDVFKVTIIAKLLMLGTLKFATLDPQGMGIEMEGGKPGWNDALNGLPGLLGSGMPETYECLRLIRYLRSSLQAYAVPHGSNGDSRPVVVPVEFHEFLDTIKGALTVYYSSDQKYDADIEYWTAASNAREQYREAILITFSGDTHDIPSSDLIELLTTIEKKLNQGVTKALSTEKSTSGLTPTYFWYECTKYKERPTRHSDDVPSVDPLAFSTRAMPLFLEGPVSQMKIIDNIDSKRDIYHKVKSSALYDEELHMYAISGSLSSVNLDVGRIVAYSPGWLENQSIWLHMSYKYYLELIRGGLYDEFYSDISTGLVPFMNSEVYGRSPVEAASFIVSSAFNDKRLHGASYLARLSGSTAEFLSIWSCMFIGQNPFTMTDENHTKIALNLRPVLPGWMFKKDNTITFTFLGSTTVTYHNPNRKNTWEMYKQSTEAADSSHNHQNSVGITKIEVKHKNGQMNSVTGGVVGHELAVEVRDGNVESIDVYYEEK